jgi:hypothetical protein
MNPRKKITEVPSRKIVRKVRSVSIRVLFKFLVFADLHLHSFRAFATYGPSGNSRRLEIANRLGEIVTEINTGNYAFAVFGGDFFHDKFRIDPESVSMAKTILGRLQRPLLMCSGTHDRLRSGATSLSVFEDMFAGDLNRIFVDAWGGVLEKFPIQAVAVPHYADCQQHQKVLKELSGSHVLLVTHGDIKGAQYGDFKNPNGLDCGWLSKHFGFSVVGHIHNRNSVRNGFQNVLIPGAVIPHGFGDGDCGLAWKVSVLSNHTFELEEIRFEHPRFITIDWREGQQDYDFNDQDYYRILAGITSPIVPAGIRHIVSQIPQSAGQAVSWTGEFDIDKLLALYITKNSLEGFSQEDLIFAGRLLAGTLGAEEICDSLEERFDNE